MSDRTYVRSVTGTLWHIEKHATPGGCVDMACGMMATGRRNGPEFADKERFHRADGEWPEPRCRACERAIAPRRKYARRPAPMPGHGSCTVGYVGAPEHASCVYLADGSKVVVRRADDVRGAVWLEHRPQDALRSQEA